MAGGLALCRRSEEAMAEELRRIERALLEEARKIPEIARLKTIPGVGDQVAVRIYAAIGDITRFPNARALASYAGLVASVRQSGDSSRHGGITREGSRSLRSALVQSGQVLLFRCTEKAGPLREIALRVHSHRARRKVAIVAAARHILRVAFYVLRDGTSYDPTKLRVVEQEVAATGT